MGVNMAMSAKATRDDVEPTTEADTRLGADVSVPFDRMTVEQFRKRFPSHGGVPHAKHGSSLAPPPPVGLRGGLIAVTAIVGVASRG